MAVLPTIPFGNNEQQLDQACTISFTTATAAAILDDVARSLVRQNIDRLVIVNAHGGNQFQPLVRDVQSQHGLLIVVANFYEMVPDAKQGDLRESGRSCRRDGDEPAAASAAGACRACTGGAGEAECRSRSRRSCNRACGRRGRGRNAIPTRAAATRRERRPKKASDTSKRSLTALADLFVDLENAKKGQLPYV